MAALGTVHVNITGMSAIQDMMRKLEDQLFIAGCGITSNPTQSPGLATMVPPTPVKFTTHPHPHEFMKTVVASYDISEREVQLGQQDVMMMVRKRLLDRIANEIEMLICGQNFDTMIKDLAKQVLKEELRKAMADRIDEFVKELAEDL